MSMKGWLAKLATTVGLMVTAFAAQAYTETGNGYNLPPGVTPNSQMVFDLHMLVFWVCVVIGALVFGVMIWSIIFHRRSKNPKPADFHESTTVEIIWTAIPFLILIGITIPAAGTLIKMEDVRDADMSIKVTGYQWKWHYDYLGEDVGFFSTLTPESNQARQLNSGIDVTQVPNYLVDVDHPLVIPVGKKVRFLITSNDVIHAWWMPDFAIKKDAIPGYVNETWARVETPGTYRGVCAELCGRDHGYMPIVVRALPQAEYDAWLAEQKGGQKTAAAPAAAPAAVPAEVAAAAVTASDAPPAAAPSAEDQLANGEKHYNAACAACHQASGAGLPPTFPSLVESKIAVAADVADFAHQIINGKNAMPPLGHLSDADIAAIMTYVRKSWGHSASAVSAADVAAQR